MVDFAKLRAPFPPERVSWRVGSTNADKTRGLALAYIDARDVQDRLDEVCGPAGWQCEFPHANGKTVCEISLWCDGPPLPSAQWIRKADGAGDTDVEAEKGALSDAFKRAAVKWGIGRYLYDLDSPWVALELAGRSYKIKESELPKLRALLAGKSAPREPDNQRLDQEAWVSGAIIDIQQAQSLAGLAQLWTDNAATIKALPDDLRAKVTAAKDGKKAQLQQKDAA